MKCSACGNDGRSESCGFCQPAELENRIAEIRDRIFKSHDIPPVMTWRLGSRCWFSFAPGQVIEVTDAEMTNLKKGATLEEILEARRAQHGNDNDRG
jgi:hypothetical protein